MSKRINVSLTEDQFHHVIRGLEYTMMDYSEMYPDVVTEDDKRATKENAFVQRLIDNIINQYKKQIS